MQLITALMVRTIDVTLLPAIPMSSYCEHWSAFTTGTKYSIMKFENIIAIGLDPGLSVFYGSVLLAILKTNDYTDLWSAICRK